MCLTHDHDLAHSGQVRQPLRLSRRDLVRGLAAGTVVAFTAGCSYNAELGRDQFLMVSDEQLVQLSLTTWRDALRTQKLSQDREMNRAVRSVGQRIVEAAGRGAQPWEYAVFDNPDANAFVLPGNKVGVNSGLFKAVVNDDQLAAVLGHETGHVTARHAAERVSQTMVAQVGLAAADLAIANSDTQHSKELAAVLGAGVQFGVLMPFSRQHELEADRIGVDFMHAAGFKPVEALHLWQNMAAERTKKAPPQWLSTHPSDETRLAALQSYLTQRGWLSEGSPRQI
jgi:predicted Zn-dependent protease